MKKCPYCFEEIEDKSNRCSQCYQFIIDELIEAEFRSLDKKKCLFCGKSILKEAKVCKHCHKWLDEIDRVANDIDQID